MELIDKVTDLQASYIPGMDIKEELRHILNDIYDNGEEWIKEANEMRNYTNQILDKMLKTITKSGCAYAPPAASNWEPASSTAAIFRVLNIVLLSLFAYSGRESEKGEASFDVQRLLLGSGPISKRMTPPRAMSP